MNNVLHSDNTGKLVIRLAVGGLLLFHGISKISGGVGGISGMLESHGLPGAMAYGAYVGEVIAPLLVLVGWLTRPAAAVIAFNMLVAIGLAHAGDIFALNPYGGWAIELPMLYLLGAAALVFTGAGRFSVSRGKGSLN